MISGETYTLQLDKFNRWLNRTDRAVTDDLRSAIWKHLPQGAPAEGWPRAEVHAAFLEQVSISGPKFSSHMHDRELQESEYFLKPWSERPKWNDWGPQTVAGYYEKPTGALSTLSEDIREFDDSWGVRTTVYPFRKAAHRLPRSTSSGLPWLTSGWYDKIGGALIAETQAQWTRDAPREIPPSMPMYRVDPPGKTRFAWAESKYEALYGAPFVYSIQDTMRKRATSPFEAWEGQAHVARNLSRDLEENDYEYLSCDYSKFDQTQSPELVRTMMNDLVHPMVGNTKPGIFQEVTDNLISGEVITPNRVFTGEHGVPSGSVATNFIDSLNNALCITGYLRNYSVKNPRYWVLGDDAVIRGKGVDPKDFAEFAQSEYGFLAHPDKQLFGHRECDFLQFSYYGENDFKPTYPVSRVGWRTIGHERYKPGWSKWAVIVRTVQQMNNAIDNPSVNELIRWAAKGDSEDLGAHMPPKQIFRMAGNAAVEMTSERSRWDAGAYTAPWDILPIQKLIREELSPN